MILSSTDVFDCSWAPEHAESMSKLSQASERLAIWLIMRGVAPNQLFVMMPSGYSGFQLGIRADNQYIDAFAKVEKDFWHFASQLVPLRSWVTDSLKGNRRKPLSTVSTGPTSFLMVIHPDPNSDMYELPPIEYWLAREELYRLRHEAPVEMLAL